MDALAMGIHYGLLDFKSALSLSFEQWPEYTALVEKVSKLRHDEAKQIADYQATQTSNRLTPNLASLVKTMMKVLSRKAKSR